MREIVNEIIEELNITGAKLEPVGICLFRSEQIYIEFVAAKNQASESSAKRMIIHEDLIRTRKSLVLSRLKSRLGLNKRRIYGRKTKVWEIERKTAIKFIDENHLMGFGGGKTFLGLFNKEDLVAVAVFSKILFMKYEDPPYLSVELERFCSLSETTVIGGLDKLIQYYLKSHQVDDVVTYVDKEWSDGSAYLQLGFEIVGDTEPLSFAVSKATFERRLLQEGESLPKGYYLVKNCGNLKLRKIC